jgi:hypothetical protein
MDQVSGTNYIFAKRSSDDEEAICLRYVFRHKLFDFFGPRPWWQTVIQIDIRNQKPSRDPAAKFAIRKAFKAFILFASLPRGENV